MLLDANFDHLVNVSLKDLQGEEIKGKKKEKKDDMTDKIGGSKVKEKVLRLPHLLCQGMLHII